MARASKQQQMLKAKEAKQKKVLIILVPVFLGLIAFQGPKMYKTVFSSPGTPDAAAAPVSPPAATPPPTETSPAPGEGALPETNVPPAGGVDRLVGFSRFTARDPFAPVGSAATAPSPGLGTGTGATDTQTASAVIEVNGAAETVSVGGNFPSSEPTFRLVSVVAGKASIGLVSGAFENGDSVVELALGVPLEIVADPDGTRYVVKLVSVATGQ